MTELSSIRLQLQSERDGLDAELRDARESLRDLQARYDSASSSLNQIKIDLENRLREKDDELENLRFAPPVIFYPETPSGVRGCGADNCCRQKESLRPLKHMSI